MKGYIITYNYSRYLLIRPFHEIDSVVLPTLKRAKERKEELERTFNENDQIINFKAKINKVEVER